MNSRQMLDIADEAKTERDNRRIDVQSSLAFLVTAGFFGCVGVYLWRPPTSDAGTLQMLSLLIGGVAAKFGDVIAYYFNTSKTSKDSNETLANVTKSLVSGTGSGDTTKLVVTPPTPGTTTVETKIPDEHDVKVFKTRQKKQRGATDGKGK